MNDTVKPKLDPKVEKTKEWLEKISGKLVESQKNQQDVENRAKGKALIDGLDREKAGIRETFLSVEFTIKTGPLKRDKKMKLLDPEGNYRNEIDTDHHTASQMKEMMSPAQEKLLTAQYEKLLAVQAELKKNPYYAYQEDPVAKTPIPDYDFAAMSDEERVAAQKELAAIMKERKEQEAEAARKKAECDKHLADDLWLPMVREGIIPENFVPQECSSVANLFKEASAAYDERLQEYSAALTEKDLLMQKFELGFKVGQSLLKAAGAGAGLGGAIGAATGDKGLVAGTEIAKQFIENFQTALTISEGITKAALTDRDFTNVGQDIAGMLGDAVGSLSGNALAGDIVTSVASNAVRAVKVAKFLKQSPPDYQGALTQMGEALAAEFARFDPEEGGGLMTLIGDNIAANVGTAFKMKDMIQKGAKPNEVLALLFEGASNLVGASVGGVDGDTAAALTEALSGVSDAVGGEDGAAIVDGRAVKKGKFDIKQLRAREQEADALAAQKVAESLQEQEEAEREEFEHHLRSGFPLAMDDDDAVNQAESDRINSIEYLIAMQKKNEAIFNMCKQIAQVGVSLLTTLFPPASLAQSCMTLAFSIKDAVEKTQELIIWCDNAADAAAAGSAQIDAMLNRKGLQTKQVMRADVQVALDASKVVADVLVLTPAAGAGPVVKAAAEATEAAIELADLVYTEVQLAKAWSIYQKAKERPQDRYLARKATRENPTLSKYAMAYGALNGDPIAVEGMRRCGLDKQVLQNTGKNVNKVVDYLESKYPEDPVLLRAVPVPDKWYPGPVELTSSSFLSFYRMATTKAVPKLSAGGDVSGITAALGRLAEAEDAFDTALDKAAKAARLITTEDARTNPVEVDPAAAMQLEATLMRVMDQVRAYKPVTEDRKPHPEMPKYLDALSAMSERRFAAVEKILEDRAWEKLYKKAEKVS